MNQLQQLHQCGQSIWLDYIHCKLIESGELKDLVAEGLRGLTSNPTIFDKAISGSEDYDKAISEIISDPDIDIEQLYEKLTIAEIQKAADIIRPVYESSNGADGFVSLEVSPRLADDTQATVREAERLWAMVDRPNLMVKVPATAAGIPAIELLISEGLNINVTLMFSLSHYESVAHAYIRGLERCPNPKKVASVASFFVSRVDTAVDKELEEINTPEALNLRGKIAVANAQMAYKRFREIFHSEAFIPNRDRGARVQRPLWASTSTKNPAYDDLLYVENLIGAETVNTLPPDTLVALRDHGEVAPALEKYHESQQLLDQLASLGVNLHAITEKLQVDGVAAFAKSYEQLLASLTQKRDKLLATVNAKNKVGT